MRSINNGALALAQYFLQKMLSLCMKLSSMPSWQTPKPEHHLK
jgi:hypothetical protein